MSRFQAISVDPEREDDLKAEGRSAMFFALRKAFKKRSEQGLQAKDLAQALHKDKGYVSRVLNGTNATMEFETLYVFLEALGHSLDLEPKPIEDCLRANFDARPNYEPATAVRTRSSVVIKGGSQKEFATTSGIAPKLRPRVPAGA